MAGIQTASFHRGRCKVMHAHHSFSQDTKKKKSNHAVCVVDFFVFRLFYAEIEYLCKGL